MTRLVFILVLATGLLPAATADVLLLDAITTAPANAAGGVPRPRSGNTMDEVLAGFGEPNARMPAVGEPPITRWTYPGYTVYFEYQHVIDVVVHR